MLELFNSLRIYCAYRRTSLLTLLLIGLLGIVYIGKTWSPSSYGYVLGHILQINHPGTVGEPRLIRSDEWAVVTPLTQATINNHYERFNGTSLYQEDLRINYGLPIHDWGLIFKPTMWLYGWVNPAYAYSAHWFALTLLFIFGYAFLFRWLGANTAISMVLSLALFFTGFVQFWWSEKAPLFAIFPWVILPFSRSWPFYLKAIIFYWVSTSWFLTNLYPPVQVSLAFVGLIILYGKQKEIFRLNQNLLLLISAAILAGATAALYLWDYLHLTATTLYPGGRHVSGGAVTRDFFISWFFPAINFNKNYDSLIGRNICEIGVVGSYYFLLGLIFIDYKNIRNIYSDALKRHLIVSISAGLILMAMWLFLPLPSWVGVPFLWDNVQPERMQYAFGVLLFCFFCVLIHDLGMQFTWPRLAMLFGICAIAYLTSARVSQTDSLNLMSMVALVLGISILLVLSKKYTFSHHLAVAIISCLIGLSLFVSFNPIQSAWPIFNREPNEMTKRFDAMAGFNNGVLAVIGLPGAVGNGLGYKSLSHVTAVPQIDFWRGVFPELSAQQLNQIFNRYAHIIPAEIPEPIVVSPDGVAVPINSLNKLIPVKYIDVVPVPIPLGGYVDRVSVEGSNYVVDGWATWFAPMGARQLEVVLHSATGKPVAFMLNRPDLPAATGGVIRSVNGFRLRIPINSKNIPTSICVISYDVSSGKRVLLNNPVNLPYCFAKQK